MCKHFYLESLGGTAIVVFLRDEPCDSYDKKTRKCKKGAGKHSNLNKLIGLYDPWAGLEGIWSADENVLDPAKLGDSCYLCKYQGPAGEDNLQQQGPGRQAVRGSEASNERMRDIWNVSMRKAKEELEREEAQLAAHNQRQAAAREARRAVEKSNICKSAVDNSQQGGLNGKVSRKLEDSEEASEEVLKAVWDDTVRKAFHAAGRGRAYDAYHEIERQRSALTHQASEMRFLNTGSSVDYNTPNPIPTPADHPTSFGITNRTPSSIERPKTRRAANNSSSSAPSSRQNSLGIENAALTASGSANPSTSQPSTLRESRSHSQGHFRGRSEINKELIPSSRDSDRSASRDHNRSSSRGRSNTAGLAANETKDKGSAPSPSKKTKFG